MPTNGNATSTAAQPAAPNFAAAMDVGADNRGTQSIGRRSSHSTSRMLVNVAGHILASTAGLVIGYYILCYIAPQANFLNLSLPGLPPPAAQSPDNAPPVVVPPGLDR